MAAKKSGKAGDGKLDVTVFVPRGTVREGDIKKAALLAARNNIPVAAYDVKLTIESASDVKTKEGQEGRDYNVSISFTPRKTTDPEGNEETVTVEKVLASLDPLTPEQLAEATGTQQEA